MTSEADTGLPPPTSTLLRKLVESRLITHQHANEAARNARDEGLTARLALHKMRVLDDDEVVAFLEAQGLPLGPYDAKEDEVAELVPGRTCQRYGLIPFRLDEEGLHVAFADPYDPEARQAALAYAPERVVPYVARTPAIRIDEERIAQEEETMSEEDARHDEREAPEEETGVAASTLNILEIRIDPEAREMLPEEFVREKRVVPMDYEDGVLHVYMPEGASLLILDEVRSLSQCEVQWEFRDPNEVAEIIEHFYAEDADIEGLAAQAGEDLGFGTDEEEEDIGVSDSAIVKLVNTILKDAISRDVSDIHVHPFEDQILVRFREDGVLRDYQKLQKNLLAAVIARIKVLSGLDIAKKRSPQDGRMTYANAGRRVSFRVSTLPTVVGEKAVMRILKNSDELLKIPQLGFSQHNMDRFIHAIEQPYGMFLVTGPTGSGKSFSLFSAMDHLNEPGVNICTVEDPVEYRLPGLAQVQTNNKAGLSFASALRSFLRQDPDIIMVGEIRDEETAKIATESALTGHLVLATLHTNDAPGAVTRLTEMGVEEFNIVASLVGVLAQRLLRRVCKYCAEEVEPDPKLLDVLDLDLNERSDVSYKVGKGCDQCFDTGYRGRIAIHELLTSSPELEDAIMKGEGTEQIRRVGIQTGMTTLRQDAIDKAFQGITTLEEVIRVTAD